MRNKTGELNAQFDSQPLTLVNHENIIEDILGMPNGTPIRFDAEVFNKAMVTQGSNSYNKLKGFYPPRKGFVRNNSGTGAGQNAPAKKVNRTML